jgi:hypothetical protein
MPSVHHEGIKSAIIDDNDLNVLLRKMRDAQNGPHIVAQQLLNLGVTDDRLPTLRVGRGECCASERQRAGGECDKETE